MGANGSKLEKQLGESFPDGERYFGLENFGNTCYCNSVLQALYYCKPLREVREAQIARPHQLRAPHHSAPSPNAEVHRGEPQQAGEWRR